MCSSNKSGESGATLSSRPVARRAAPLALGRVWRGGEWAPPAGKPQPAPLPRPSRVGPPGRQPQGIWTPEVFGSGPAAAPAQPLGLRGLLAAVGWERVELTSGYYNLRARGQGRGGEGDTPELRPPTPAYICTFL